MTLAIPNTGAALPIPIGAIAIPADGLRRAAVTAEQQAGMADSVRILGVLQPIIVRSHPTDATMRRLVAGRRRLAAAIEAGLDTIPAYDRGEISDADALAIEAAENMQRAAMAPVDRWRALRRLQDLGWRIEGAADALGIPHRQAQRLAKLGSLHPDVLAAIEAYDMPRDSELAEMASAPLDVQAAAMAREPHRLQPAWWRVAAACRQATIPKVRAIFDTDLAGVVWEEDLFAEPGSPGQFTTRDVAGFMEAQRAALDRIAQDSKGKLQVVKLDKHGDIPLPKGWQEHYGWRFVAGGENKPPPRGHVAFLAINANGNVISRAAKKPAPAKPEAKASASAKPTIADDDEAEEDQQEEQPRPAPAPPPGITQRGQELLAAARTAAIRTTLRDKPRNVVEAGILLLLSLCAKNVAVTGEPGNRHRHTDFEDIAAAAWSLLPEARDFARAVVIEHRLAKLLSEAAARILIVGPTPAFNGSGDAAQWVGMATGAGAALPRIDTPEILATLSGAILRDAAVTALADAKAAKLSTKVLRDRLAGNAPLLAEDIEDALAFRADPPVASGDPHATGEKPCGRAAGLDRCGCGWWKSRSADEDCAAADLAVKLARLAPWPQAPAPGAVLPATAPPPAAAEHACRWDGRTQCPDDLTEACMKRCPRRDEYDRWWESPEADGLVKGMPTLAPPTPSTAKPAPSTRKAPPSTGCAWDGKAPCREEGTTSCARCPRTAEMQAWAATQEGRAARRRQDRANTLAARRATTKGMQP